jgi:capsular polysaccharide biosynthesis protein
VDLNALLRLLGRQWFVVLTALLIAASSAYGAWVTADPTYQSTAVVSVLPALTSPEGQQQNPYDALGNRSTAEIANRLTIQMNGTEWRRSIRSQGLSAKYLVDNGDGTSGILRTTVETDNPEQAQATLDAVVAGMGDELANQQGRFELPADRRYTLDVLTASTEARQLFGNRTRLTVSVLLLGVGAAIAVALLADNLERTLRDRVRTGTAARTTRAPTAPDGAGPEQMGEANGRVRSGEEEPQEPVPSIFDHETDEVPVEPADADADADDLTGIEAADAPSARH